MIEDIAHANAFAVADPYRAATHNKGILNGIDAVAKAERVADAMLTRVRRMLDESGLGDFRATRVEILGAESVYGPHGRRQDAREVVLRLSVHHDRRRQRNRALQRQLHPHADL